jgi:predicted SAM-dependent methyltransferase
MSSTAVAEPQPTQTARPNTGRAAANHSPMSGRSRKLHLGCGLMTPAAWLNVDGSLNARLGRYPLVGRLARAVGLTNSKTKFDKSVYGHDLRRPLPWPDGSFDAVYASHLFEHMYVDEVKRLLLECRRVLAPGGVVRIVVPDLAVLIEGYAAGKFPEWTKGHIKDGPRADMFVTSILMRDPVAPRGGLIRRVYQAMFDFHSHKWMYDGESMSARLTEAGFRDVKRMGFGESRIEGILEVEHESRVNNGAGVVVEGVK